MPHRLNAEERKRFDLARRHGFLTVQGTAYRKERRGSPLVNTHRMLCDAEGVPVVRVEQNKGGQTADVHVDFAPMRLADPGRVRLAKELYSERVRRAVGTAVAGDESGAAEAKDSLPLQSTSALLGIDSAEAEAGFEVAGRGNEHAAKDAMALRTWELPAVGVVVRLSTRAAARAVALALAEPAFRKQAALRLALV